MKNTLQISEFTDEDQKELDRLEDDFKQEKRKSKLEIFKKLPSSSRETVLDKMRIQDAAASIYNIDGRDTPKEIQDLNQKRRLSREVFGMPSGNKSYRSEKDRGHTSNPFYEFEIEELEQAHTSEALEEELLKR